MICPLLIFEDALIYKEGTTEQTIFNEGHNFNFLEHSMS